jgi:hypothetical protein
MMIAGRSALRWINDDLLNTEDVFFLPSGSVGGRALFP